MSNRFEKRSKTTLLIIMTIVMVGLLFGFEKLLGSSTFGGDNKEVVRHIRLKENSPQQNRIISPDAERLQESDSLEDKKYSFITDENGFIFPSQLHKNPNDTIAFIGGSTTECMFVDETMRFPALVGEIFYKNGKRVNTINAGVSGNNTLHSINIFTNKILPQKPTIAVLMHNINDLTTLLHEETYWNQNKYRSTLVVEDHSIKSVIKHSLPNTYNLLFNLKTKLFGGINEFSNTQRDKNSIDSHKILEMFRHNLNIFISIAKTKNIKPVLMTQANRFTLTPDKLIINNLRPLKSIGLSYDEYRTLYEAMNDEIRKVANTQQVLLIDLAKQVPQTNEYMADPVHFNNTGSEFVANLIAKRLKALLAK